MTCKILKGPKCKDEGTIQVCFVIENGFLFIFFFFSCYKVIHNLLLVDIFE